MGKISFSELISGVHLRSATVEIEGLGELSVMELSSLEAAQLRESVGKVDEKDIAGSEEFMAFWACRLMLGEKPTEEQVASLRRNLSNDVIHEIYIEGCRFNMLMGDSKEDAEKKS